MEVVATKGRCDIPMVFGARRGGSVDMTWAIDFLICCFSHWPFKKLGFACGNWYSGLLLASKYAAAEACNLLILKHTSS